MAARLGQKVQQQNHNLARFGWLPVSRIRELMPLDGAKKEQG
jgi:hypothetical protein